MTTTPYRVLLTLSVATLFACAPDGADSRATEAELRTVFDAPSELPTDCSADVTADLNAWLSRVPDEATLRFPANGCLRVEGTLVLRDRRGLLFEGNGVTLKSLDAVDLTKNNGNRALLYVEGGERFRVRNMAFVGSHPDVDDYHPNAEHLAGIRMRGVQGALLDGISISFVWGDMIELKNDVRSNPAIPCRNVMIQRSTFNRSGRQGIFLAAGERITVRWNTFRNIHFSVVDHEETAGGGVASQIEIVDNVVHGPDTAIFVASTHKYVEANDWLIARNRLYRKTLEVVVYTASTHPKTNFRILDNESDMLGGAVARLYSVHGAVVSGNRAPVKSDRPGVAINSAQDIRVENNTFAGARDVLEVDHGLWKGQPYQGPPSERISTCGNVLDSSGPVDGPCR